MNERDKGLYISFITNPQSILNVARVKKRCIEMEDAAEESKDDLTTFKNLLATKKPLILHKSMLISTTECDWGTICGIMQETKGCVSVITVERRNNVMILDNIACPLPIPPGTDGRYYMLMDHWDNTIYDIYLHGEDALLFYETSIMQCTIPPVCDHNISAIFINFAAPHIDKVFSEYRADDMPDIIKTKFCGRCLEDKPVLFKTAAAYVQMKYNEHMHYPAVLPLLLYAHARLEDNVFYKYKLGRDIFKAILRNVFPPAFALIK